MKTYEEALVFRAGIVNALAEKYPEICNKSGVGFWPVPVMTPCIFAKCLNLLEQECFSKVKVSNYETRDLLVQSVSG